MTGPSMFGYKNMEKLSNVNIVGLGQYTKSSVKSDFAQLGMSLLSTGLFAFAQAKMAKSGDKVVNTDPKGQQVNTPEATLQILTAQKDAIEAEIKSYGDTITELSKKTDPQKIASKKESVDKLKEELFGAKSENKELAEKINICNSKVSTAQTNLETATNNYNTLNHEAGELKREKGNVDKLLNSPDKNLKSQAETRSKELEIEIAAKEKAAADAKTKIDEAEAIKNLAVTERNDLKTKEGENFTKVNLMLETYDKEKAELDDLNSSLATNQNNLKIASQQKGKLEADLVKLKSQISSIENKLLEQKGEQVGKDGVNAKDFTDGDSNDGNWWKRNMPSWLGGAKKSNRAGYKEAREQRNNALEEYMAAHPGMSKSEAKEALKNINRTNNHNQYIQENPLETKPVNLGGSLTANIPNMINSELIPQRQQFNNARIAIELTDEFKQHYPNFTSAKDSEIAEAAENYLNENPRASREEAMKELVKQFGTPKIDIM